MENIEPINEHRERWDATFERLRAAEIAFAEYAHGIGHRRPLADRNAVLVDIAWELMATPAPDLAALRWKLDWTSDAEYTDEYLAQMRADMDRLMGPAPSLSGDVNSPSKVPA